MAEQAELTVMYYFASRNALAPLVISELKAIKDAGFQQNTNVLVYFDPAEPDVECKLYDVNRKRKEQFKQLAQSHPDHPTDQIGDDNDSFVRKMEDDEIPITPAIQPTSTGAERLDRFVNFGIANFPADNFILILDGHGQLVGNDAFLPEDDPNSAITLNDLKTILANFTKSGSTTLQLLGLHSCSMSSIEVAYQLKGLAKYMIATQGLTFVNSWPVRQLFKKILNRVKQVKDAARDQAIRNNQDKEQAASNAHLGAQDLQDLIEKLYFLCMHNATDFNSAGYSTDLVLCNLDPANLVVVRRAVEELTGILKKNMVLDKNVVKDLVLLAHWESQSFFGESHSDLFDFCDCLGRRCEDAKAAHNDMVDDLTKIGDACARITKLVGVAQDYSKRFDNLIVHADNSGSKYQYARGQSIYFPWHEPREEDTTRVEPPDRLTKFLTSNTRIFEKYEAYDFNQEADNGNSWASFLHAYFSATLRPARYTPGHFIAFAPTEIDIKSTDEDENARANREAALAAAFSGLKDEFIAGVTLEPKRTPEEGELCLCPTIKNHPQFSITPQALRRFAFAQDDEEDDR